MLYNLIPFGGEKQDNCLSEVVILEWRERVFFDFIYQIKGPVKNLEKIQDSRILESLSLERKNDLWKSTCFEWFIKSTQGQTLDKPYWEFNISPWAEWNFYKLNYYRSSLSECQDIELLKFQMELKDTFFELRISIGVQALFQKNPELAEDFKIGVSTVLAWPNGQRGYFALNHPNVEKPDFHDDRGFGILSSVLNAPKGKI